MCRRCTISLIASRRPSNSVVHSLRSPATRPTLSRQTTIVIPDESRQGTTIQSRLAHSIRLTIAAMANLETGEKGLTNCCPLERRAEMDDDLALGSRYMPYDSRLNRDAVANGGPCRFFCRNKSRRDQSAQLVIDHGCNSLAGATRLVVDEQ